MGASKELFGQIRDEMTNLMFAVDQGDRDALDVYMELRELKAETEETLKTFKAWESENFDEILNDADSYRNEFKGFEIKKRNGGKTMVYDNIPEITEAQSVVKELQSKYKLAFEGIQRGATISQTKGFFTDADGVELPLPTVKYRKDSISVTRLKK